MIAHRAWLLSVCAACTPPAAVADPSPPVPETKYRIDHPEPDIANCVARAYETTGRTDRIDGVISADRTGLAPRYLADPALPGLVDCVAREHGELKGSTSFRVGVGGKTIEVVAVPKVEGGGEEPELPMWFGGEYSACVAKQKDLRVPQEGALLTVMVIEADGRVSRIDRVAATIQADQGVFDCTMEEFETLGPGSQPIPPPGKRVVLNFRRHLHIKEPY